MNVNSDGNRAEDWKTYTDQSGKTYYYNVVTKETSWAKPKPLLTASDIANGDTWKAFTTAEGKMYWHNTFTGVTTWSRPPEWKDAGFQILSALGGDGPRSPSLGSISPTSDIEIDQNEAYGSSQADGQAAIVVPEYATKREKVLAFREMLEEQDFDPETSWQDVLKYIVNDPRYQVLKTLGERKAVFNDYCERKRKEDREKLIIQRKRHREDFMQMLEEDSKLTSDTPWKTVIPRYEVDRRYTRVESAVEREALYEDYLVILARKEKEMLRQRRKQQMAEFRELLEECKMINSQSQWRRVQEFLDADPRYQALDKMHRLIVFEDYIHELERKEEERKVVDKEDRKRSERRCREEFRALMKDYNERGLLDYTTKWRDFSALLGGDPVFDAVVKQGLARDMFADFIEELEQQFRDHYKIIRQVMQDLDYELTLGVSFDAFKKKLSPELEGRFDTMASNRSLRLTYDSLYARAEEKEKEKERRHQKMVDRLVAALRALPQFSPEATYEDVLQVAETLPAYQAVEDDLERKKIVLEHFQKIKRSVGGKSPFDGSGDGNEDFVRKLPRIDNNDVPSVPILADDEELERRRQAILARLAEDAGLDLPE